MNTTHPFFDTPAALTPTPAKQVLKGPRGWLRQWRTCLTAILAGLLAAVPSVSAQSSEDPACNFDYVPDFFFGGGLNLVNAARFTSELMSWEPGMEYPVELTSATPGLNGTVIFGRPVLLRDGFETEFTLRIRQPAGALDQAGQPGGDGLALVIQRQGGWAAGPHVGYIPYSIPDALAIEFDTWQNSNLLDPNGNHISVQDVGPAPNGLSEFHHNRSLGWTTAPVNLSDGEPHTFRVSYYPGELRVYLLSMNSAGGGLSTGISLQEILVVPLDLTNVGGRNLLAEDGTAWIGLAAGTGATYEVHEILDWWFLCNDLNGANQPPTAQAQALSTPEDAAVGITLGGSDPDGNPLTYSVASGPSHGTLSGTAPALTYTPAANYFGSDSFNYILNDGTTDSTPATVSITVNPVNDPPVANNQSVTTAEDTPLEITLSGNDVEDDVLSYIIVSSPTRGTLTGTAPNLTYTPVANFHGPDGFLFKINDGDRDSAPVAVSITVTPVDDPPAEGGIDVWAWGSDEWGQLGNLGGGIPRPDPVFAPGAWSGRVLVDITAGYYHSLVALDDGSVWAWGQNTEGQLGVGSFYGYASSPQSVTAPPAWNGHTVLRLAAGGHSLAVLDDGSLWSWGRGNEGQLGIGNQGSYPSPQRVSVPPSWNGRSVVDVAAGGYHSLAVLDDGSVWAWGRGDWGQLGNGQGANSYTPQRVLAPPAWSSRKIVSVAAGDGHSLGLLDDGSVWAWGFGLQGQMGNGQYGHFNSVPVAVSKPAAWNGRKVEAIAAGLVHSLALLDDGGVWAWGQGTEGQLGNGILGNTPVPQPVQVPAEWAARKVERIAGGAGHSLAVLDDGSAWAWGYGLYGQLGHSQFGSSSVPVPVAAPPSWTSRSAWRIAGGRHHTLVILQERSVVPVAAVDEYTITEDVVLEMSAPGLLGNDIDADGDLLSVIDASSPAHGALEWQRDGSFTYAPSANFHGTDGFTYTAADPAGLTATATVTITVTPVNDPPMVSNPIADFTVEEDSSPVTLDLAAVFADDETPAAELTYSLVANSNPGLVASSVAPDTGALGLTFTPDSFGSATVIVRATDAEGASAEDSFVVTVNRVRDLLGGELDPSFDVGSGIGGKVWESSVFAVTPQPDGKVLIGGEFTTIHDALRSRVARLNADGSTDYSFDPGAGANATVRAVELQPDGRVLLGGYFSNVDGIVLRSIARLNPDGSVDTGFTPGSGADGGVTALVLLADGKVVIGGEFTSFNGVSRSRIARLNGDGSLDTTFDPGLGADRIVATIAVQPDGKLIIGGNFTSFNGVSRNRIARLNTDGSIDTSFDPGPGADGFVNRVALESDGSLLVSGQFTQFNGVSRNRIARLNADGSLDAQFAAGAGADYDVYGLAVLPDGRILIAGLFDWVNGTIRNRIARLNADGSLDTTFDPGSGANNTVVVITPGHDGQAFIGGSFTTVNGASRPRFARLNPDGSVDAAFNTGPAIDNAVRSLASQSDGRILIGGYFTAVQGVALNRIARLNPDGSVDSGFNPGSGVSGEVTSIAVQPDEKILIGGQFGWVNSILRPNIARLNPNGSLDLGFNPGAGANAMVWSVAVGTDGKVLLGGNFTTLGGANRNRVGRLNADGSLDTTFNPGLGANNDVYSVALQSDRKAILGGHFTSFNGASRNRIVRLNPDGSLDETFSIGSGANGEVQAVAIQQDGRILLGGWFSFYNGSYRGRIARLHPDGSLDTTFSGFASDRVNSIALQSDGKVLLGGNFASVTGVGPRVARLNRNGSLDTSFDPGAGANQSVWAVLGLTEGDVLMGGSFTTVDGQLRPYLARLEGGPLSPNRPPTEILLTGDSVLEDTPVGTPVGTFSATDADTEEAHTFALVSGAGDTDNAVFSLVGNQLRTAITFDHEVRNSYSIRVRVTDAGGSSAETVFSIQIVNVNEPPSIADQALTLEENSPYGISIGFVQASDPDTGDTLTYRFTGVSVPGVFGILSNTGELSILDNGPLDFETTPEFTLTVEVSDAAGLTATGTVTIQLNDVNEAPAAIVQSVTTAEDTSVAITLSGSDPEGIAPQYAVVTQPAHGSLTGTPPSLTYRPFFGFQGNDQFSFTVSDGTIVSVPATVSISVTPVNDPPEALAQSVVTAEDTPVAITLAGIDPEAGGYTVLHTYGGADGRTSHGQVIEGSDGRLYGTTRQGGASDRGLVFRVEKDGTGYTVLHSFSGPDGDQPYSGVMEGTDGMLYGTTVQGGPGLEGVVYRLARDGSQFEVIHHFTFPNGGARAPQSAPIEGSDGLLYGTTRGGGAGGVGAIYRLDPVTRDYAVLHSLASDGSQGQWLSARLIEGNDGGLYGVAEAGGNAGAGVLFRLERNGTAFTILHHFGVTTDDGQIPSAGLAIGSDGAFYGTTFAGGMSGRGTIFKLHQDGTGYAVLRGFSDTGGDPAQPDRSVLALGPDGQIYGTSRGGGLHGAGSLFRVNSTGSQFQVLHSFHPSNGDGRSPWAGVHVDLQGNIFGVTSTGSITGYGTLFRLSLASGGVTYVVDQPPQHGTLSGTPPNLVYTPAPNYSGPDQFFFQINDGSVGSGAKVSITVLPVNDLPAADAQSLETYDNEQLAITLAGSDIETANLTYRILDGPTAGTVSGTPPNLVYTPPFPFAGNDSFTFEVEDAGGAIASATVAITILASDRPPVAVAGADQSVLAGTDYCWATVTVDGSASSDPDSDALSYSWQLFLNGEVIETTAGWAAVSWNLSHGSYEAVLTVTTDKNGNLVSRSDSLVIVVLPSAPVLTGLTPAGAYTGGPDFTLTVTGGCFLPGTVVHWNGQPRTTTVVSSGEVTAAIPASDLLTGVDIAVASIQVVNGDGQVSNPLGFSIVAQTVGTADAAVSQPGEITTVSTAPTIGGEPGVSVAVQNDGDQPVTVLAASYDERPVGETVFQVDNGSFVDVQVTGADEDVSAAVFFYYPSDITGGMENRTKLRYFNGVDWIPVLSSGGLPPAKDTTDNLDNTISGGRFTVVFDMTSTPTITDLTGTVFGMFESLPQIDAVSGPAGPVALGTSVTVSVDYVALGAQDAVAVNFVWDDGTESTGAQQVAGRSSSTHLYAAPGVYGVTVEVVDGEGDVREGRFEYVVIYDPNGGFVTGGGWINSPAGAYPFDATLTGRATFGFVSKYKKGTSVPIGETQFQFEAGDFKFHSALYEWLVVSGSRSQFKGWGMVNGQGEYGFLLTATDGQVKGGGGIDKFRIKIWDRASGTVVYDNVLGTSDDLDKANPQVIGGGSIVMQGGK